MISDKHKYIFVHIAKCGGCSMNVLPDTRGTGHKPLDEIIKNNPGSSDYFSFTFVRNPWARLVSGYSMFKSLSYDCAWVKFDKKEMDFCKKFNFKDFIYAVKIGHIVKPHTKPYIGHYFKDPSDLDFIGKLENYQKDFDTVCDKIGIPKQKVPHANKSKHKRYTEYYDDETKEIVAEKYARDIDHFGYKFGD